MNKPQRHFFVCTNARPPFAKPSCGQNDGHQILMGLREEAEQRGLLGEVKITGCGCLGPCEEGPAIVVYPEATWYQGVSIEDIQEIVESHMVNGLPVDRLIYDFPDTVE